VTVRALADGEKVKNTSSPGVRRLRSASLNFLTSVGGPIFAHARHMWNRIAVVVLCGGCEFGGGAGRVGEALGDASTVFPDAKSSTDAPHHADALLDATIGSGSCADATTGVLATWAFAGATGNQASQPAASMATGVTAGELTRSSDLVAESGADSINSSAWPTAATLDVTQGYYTASLTPPAGCTLSLTSASITGRASGSGPANAVVGTSADTFAATTAITVSATDTTSTPALAVSDAAAVIEVRIFGYAATSSSGTFRLDGTLTLSGSLQ
jgi:hypothetical protein